MEKTKETKVGKVVSTSMDKTIVVLTETYKKHPLYKKRVKYSKKYAVHDESNKAKVGDIVKIVETRPLSATKRFYLKEIIKITNKNIKVHIKIDTGMNRLGVSSKNELNEIVHIINSNKNIYLEGLFTIRCTSRGRVE